MKPKGTLWDTMRTQMPQVGGIVDINFILVLVRQYGFFVETSIDDPNYPEETPYSFAAYYYPGTDVVGDHNSTYSFLS
jgi:hypothetical protein